ncbi:SDR family oxidoreductase [Gordonia sp. NB41Y]|uniref:SDR family NAD(P)-dependent oxidoreductase n=1 Tax=Gordonia sp. NB41Y TaxID=875808 RepID=UPI0002BE2AF9|nr:SDR family oxidoreductase [Gordonia sp. NB41Y]WLP93104.1 SDR family oxidoreductase [Gordonia sp. NB41Y]
MDAIEAIAADVRAEGVRSQAMALDITDAARSEAVIADVVSQFGRLDILVNNAGAAIGVGDFADVPDGEWELSWQVNVLGATRISRLAVPHLAQHGHGAIVNVASTAGLIGIAGYGAYNVAKHGVVGLTRLLAAELGPRGIRVNAVAPVTALIEIPQ